MAPLLVGLLLLPLLGRVSAGGSEQALSCELRREEYDAISDGLLRFFLLGDPFGRGKICDVLELLASSGCADLIGDRQKIDWRGIGEEYCSSGFGLGSSTVGSRRISSRKVLLELSQNCSFSFEGGRGKKREGGEEHGHSLVSPKEVAIGVPVAFLLCCAFLCPCFQKKGKQFNDEQPLNDLSAGRLSTSPDYPRSFGTIPGSPRMPTSPLRAPPSPFRKPIGAGLSRFAIEQSSATGPLQMKMKQILAATQNFSDSHVIGEGGFGVVYRAELPNGLVVAIKRAKKEHFADFQDEFKNEIQLLSQIEHQNLVRLLGYIDEANERILISEYVANGTLRDHLDGRDGRTLDFSQRLSISIDVAHALTYLHFYASEKPIIHRDVKSSNILLTENLRVKVADFGLARTGPSVGGDQTHISTAVKGTAGYVDPEYILSYRLTPKSDVFSFGVLLIEILSGRRPIEAKRPFEERITLRWAFMLDKDDKAREVLDPNIKEVVEEETLSKLLQLAFECAAPTQKDRPSMKHVGERLWDIRREYSRHRNGVYLSG